MATITAKGRELAAELAKYTTLRAGAQVADMNRLAEGRSEMAALCSRIARLSATHTRLQETSCNRPLTAREEAQDKRTEELISGLVKLLPVARWRDESGSVHGAQWRATFTGDPRGYTVRVVLPKEYPGAKHLGNTWGRDGEFGV